MAKKQRKKREFKKRAKGAGRKSVYGEPTKTKAYRLPVSITPVVSSFVKEQQDAVKLAYQQRIEQLKNDLK